MGADYLLHVSTPIGTLRFSRRHRGTVPEKGESLPIGFSPADVHLFHAETQHNLAPQTSGVIVAVSLDADSAEEPERTRST